MSSEKMEELKSLLKSKGADKDIIEHRAFEKVIDDELAELFSHGVWKDEGNSSGSITVKNKDEMGGHTYTIRVLDNGSIAYNQTDVSKDVGNIPHGELYKGKESKSLRKDKKGLVFLNEILDGYVTNNQDPRACKGLGTGAEFDREHNSYFYPLSNTSTTLQTVYSKDGLALSEEMGEISPHLRNAFWNLDCVASQANFKPYYWPKEILTREHGSLVHAQWKNGNSMQDYYFLMDDRYSHGLYFGLGQGLGSAADFAKDEARCDYDGQIHFLNEEEQKAFIEKQAKGSEDSRRILQAGFDSLTQSGKARILEVNAKTKEAIRNEEEIR